MPTLRACVPGVSVPTAKRDITPSVASNLWAECKKFSILECSTQMLKTFNRISMNMKSLHRFFFQNLAEEPDRETVKVGNDTNILFAFHKSETNRNDDDNINECIYIPHWFVTN